MRVSQKEVRVEGVEIILGNGKGRCKGLKSEETGSEKKGVIGEGDNSSDIDGKAGVKVRSIG